MAKKSKWRLQANTAITNAINKAKMAGKEGSDLIEAIDAAYPFGTRENHPYKIWLKERTSILALLGIVERSKMTERTKKTEQKIYKCQWCKDSQQGCLLCGSIYTYD